MIDVTVAGTVKRRQALTRAGARPGDELYVSGVIGSARAGLFALRDAAVPSAVELGVGPANRLRQGFGAQEAGPHVRACVDRYLRPDPHVRLGTWLGRNRAASACIDLSDGLADGVHRIAESSGVGVTVDADALPIADSARAVFEERGDDAVLEAIAGGDDYELLFTVRRRMQRSVMAGARQTGVPVTRIGVCTDGAAVVMRRAGIDMPLALTGYDHFGATASAAPAHE